MVNDVRSNAKMVAAGEREPERLLRGGARAWFRHREGPEGRESFFDSDKWSNAAVGDRLSSHFDCLLR